MLTYFSQCLVVVFVVVCYYCSREDDGWWLDLAGVLEKRFIYPKIWNEPNAWELTYTSTGTPSKDEQQALFSQKVPTTFLW